MWMNTDLHEKPLKHYFLLKFPMENEEIPEYCVNLWLRCFFSPRAYPSEGKLALLKAHHAKCAMNAIGVCAHIYGNVQTKKHIFHAFLALYEFKYEVKRGLIVWMLVVRSKLQSNSQLFKIVSNI